MQVFNLKTMKSYPYEEREIKMSFIKLKNLKQELSNFHPAERMPICEMVSYVIFYALKE